MMPTFCITSLPVITPRIARISTSKPEASSLRRANVGAWTLLFDDRRGGLQLPLNDEPVTPLSADERPDPLEEHAQPETRLGQREDVDQSPREPGEERLEMQLAALEDRVPRTDHRHASAIGVAKRTRRALPGHATGDRLPRITPLLDRRLRQARKRLAVPVQSSSVADDALFRIARQREV